MSEPTNEELHESIKMLTSYRNRLTKAITSISQKLQMPQRKIDQTLESNSELKEIENTLAKLIKQKEDTK